MVLWRCVDKNIKYHLSYIIETPTGHRYCFTAPNIPKLLKNGCNDADEVKGSLYNFVFNSEEESNAFNEQNGGLIRENLIEIAHSVSIVVKDTGVCSWSG